MPRNFVYNITFRTSLTIPLSSLLILILLVCCAPPLSASAEPLRWTRVNIPTGNEAGNWVLAAGSNIRSMAAAADGALYAAVQGLPSTLYKSTDGGLTWTAAGNVQDTIVDIAVSSDDPSRIYYATTSTVYRSLNGGRTFAALIASPGGAGTGNKQITSIDAAGSGKSIVAAAVRDNDNAEYGGVYFLDETNIVPAWTDTGIGNYDVCALAFSPSYSADQQIIAVITNENDTFITGKIGESGWGAVFNPARLNRDNAVPPVPCPAVSAALAFPGGYNANSSSGSNVFYAAVSTGTGEGDVYIIESVEVPETSTATDLNAGRKYGFDNMDFNVLAVTGSYPETTLLAGDSNSARIYISPDGGLNWNRARKEPSGGSVTCLFTDRNYTSSGLIYAATSGANSGLSISRDMGVTWNQVSLIDTSIDVIVDFAPSPSYTQDNTIFMLTFGNGHSLWRSRNGGLRWERILTHNLSNVNTLKLIGLPPGYSGDNRTIFIAGESNGNPAVWQSTDDGQSYRCRPTHDPITGNAFPIDVWAIVNDKSFLIGSYNGSNGLVYLTSNSGFTYTDGTPAGTQSLNSLVISPFYQRDGAILVGNTNGWVYLSTDNNTSFHPLPGNAVSPPLTGSVTIAFDPRFNGNHIVYAGCDSPDGGIHRFNTATGREWVNIDSTPPTGTTINRIATGKEGTLYAVNSLANNGMERCLYPTATANMTFERVTGSLPSGARLYGLWQCGHYLWSTEITGTSLMTFYDTLTTPIVQASPGNKAAGLGNINNHTIRNIILDWETLPGATGYEWQCDFTSEFAGTSGSLGDTTSASSVRLPQLEPATRYHWRVRASTPLLSPWSEERTFTTSLDTEAIILKPESPIPGAKAVPLKPSFQWTAIAGASAYELMVSDNTDFNNPIINRAEQYAIPTNAWQCDISLKYNTFYYWKVRAVSDSTHGYWSSTGLFTTEQEPVPDLPLIFPTSNPGTISTGISDVPAAPLPVLPIQNQEKPDTNILPPQNTGTLPDFNQPVSLPAWIIYFMFGLMSAVILSLFIIFLLVARTRRR